MSYALGFAAAPNGTLQLLLALCARRSDDARMLAIDFGTTRTKVAYLDETKREAALVRLGRGGDFAMPSLLYVADDGELFVGAEAAELLERDPSGAVRVLKRHLRGERIRMPGRGVGKFHPVELLTKVLQAVRERVREEVSAFHGKDLVEVVLTLPGAGSGAGPVVERAMSEAAKAAGFTKVHLLSEPEAAALAWSWEGAGAAAQDDVVVVLDCGGGTVDWACLKRKGTRLEPYPECPADGDDKVGGEVLDEELLELVRERLETSGDREATDALERGPGAALERLRAMREAYCLLKGRKPSGHSMRFGAVTVELDADEVGGVLRRRFVEQVCLGFGAYLDRVRAKTGVTRPKVLLVGGSAKVLGLKEALEAQCGVDAIRWERSEFATVLGAAWFGHERQDLIAAEALAKAEAHATVRRQQEAETRANQETARAAERARADAEAAEAAARARKEAEAAVAERNRREASASAAARRRAERDEQEAAERRAPEESERRAAEEAARAKATIERHIAENVAQRAEEETRLASLRQSQEAARANIAAARIPGANSAGEISLPWWLLSCFGTFVVIVALLALLSRSFR